MPELRLYYRIQVKDKNDKVIYDTGEVKSHSFVLQFLQHMQAGMGSMQVASVRDVTNILRTISQGWFSPFMEILCAAGDSTYGIVVGSGSNAPTNTDYNLQTKINHGTGAGQLSYEGHALTTTAVIGTVVEFEVRRTFTNLSGGDVTINEIGLISRNYAVGTTRYFLLARDTITSLVLANGLTMIVRYIPRTDVAA